MMGPAPLTGGRKSSPVGRSGTQDVIVSGARLRIEAAGNSLVLPSSRKLFCAYAVERIAAAAQHTLDVRHARQNFDIKPSRSHTLRDGMHSNAPQADILSYTHKLTAPHARKPRTKMSP